MNKLEKKEYIENLDKMSKEYSALFVTSFTKMSVKEMIQICAVNHTPVCPTSQPSPLSPSPPSSSWLGNKISTIIRVIFDTEFRNRGDCLTSNIVTTPTNDQVNCICNCNNSNIVKLIFQHTGSPGAIMYCASSCLCAVLNNKHEEAMYYWQQLQFIRDLMESEMVSLIYHRYAWALPPVPPGAMST